MTEDGISNTDKDNDDDDDDDDGSSDDTSVFYQEITKISFV